MLAHRMLCRRLVVNAGARLLSSASSPPARTVLYDLHVAHGGKMVDFAGFDMPVQYADMSIGESTMHTRAACSIFDVSHMLQTNVTGKDRVAYMECMTTADVAGLAEGTGTLTVFTNDVGGIMDDLIVTKSDDHSLYVVTNAGCIAGDTANMASTLAKCRSAGDDVHVEHLHGRGLLAVQGPTMRQALQPGLSDDLSKLTFMHSVRTKVFGIDDCRVTRCGYTGEDGVEISVPTNRTVELCERLLADTAAGVKLAGLGARDALRLEAGLCLYGNDLDATTTPVEATLLWLVAKRRREDWRFPGADTIRAQIADKSSLTRKRVGFVASKGRPPRAGMRVLDADTGDDVGIVTSGCPSPCLKQNIGMAYVQPQYMKAGTALCVAAAGGNAAKSVPIVVTKMPFIPSNYYTGK